MTKAGPKEATSQRALIERALPQRGGVRVAAWVERVVVIPKGTGEGSVALSDREAWLNGRPPGLRWRASVRRRPLGLDG